MMQSNVLQLLERWIGKGPFHSLHTSSKHHFLPFHAHNYKCCLIHPAVMRHKAHENIQLLLMTQRKYTCGINTGAHPVVLNRLPDLQIKQNGKERLWETSIPIRADSVWDIRVVNNSSSFGQINLFSYRVVVSGLEIQNVIPIGDDTFRENMPVQNILPLYESVGWQLPTLLNTFASCTALTVHLKAT